MAACGVRALLAKPAVVTAAVVVDVIDQTGCGSDCPTD
jgi:hypothetical protein